MKDKLLRALKMRCGISAGYDPGEGGQHPAVYPFIGLWDTGSAWSVISRSVADRIGLKPIGGTKVSTLGGLVTASCYQVNIYLPIPDEVCFMSVKVTEGNHQGCDVLLGMDIISLGNFTVTNEGGKTAFSFTIPSNKDIEPGRLVMGVNGLSRNIAAYIKTDSSPLYNPVPV